MAIVLGLDLSTQSATALVLDTAKGTTVARARAAFGAFKAWRAEFERRSGVKLPKGKAGAKGKLAYPVKDFYLTNPVARASQLMAELSALAKARAQLDASAAVHGPVDRKSVV